LKKREEKLEFEPFYIGEIRGTPKIRAYTKFGD
jgi:hypothetical protein